MKELLVDYWPYLTGVLALFLKPGPKPVWKMLLDSVVKPKPNTTTKPDVLSLLPMLIERLAKKPPVDVTPVTDPPSTPHDIIAMITDLLSKPDGPPAVNEDHATHDMQHLVSCAESVAKKHPDYDITVVVNDTGVKVDKTKRVKPQ
jgi:hypothetical protein